MQLREVFPKERIPRVPPKHYIRSGTSRELINERKALLQQYLEELGATSCVTNWSEFAQWLEPSNDVSNQQHLHSHHILLSTISPESLQPPFSSLDKPNMEGFLLKEGIYHCFSLERERRIG